MARHIYSCPLRWSDMDAFGHVNNVVYLRYLEEARVDFIWRLAPGDGSGAFTGGVVVARHEISYLRPLFHRHAPVTVELWVKEIGAAFITLGYEVKDEETVYARASTMIVPYDLERGRPRRLTSEEEGFLVKYREDGADDAAEAAPEAAVATGRDEQPEGAVTV
ncbi:thioesterase family protein [Streptomyces sp. FXJ1.4098]|uniref:acyl-CoA thioesterase n=1 Tax=Streptomyces sp. NPDC020845 TaxID=3365096 RepID=UPI00299B9F18|nr:thioesterase family protein [Streptomyces sp. FXJ1.4098]